ncbi:helix-turn-helix domain-containing protein [Nocardioides sp.]|uniref:helix-turn-helix domain-containing protein n=1 Tax=Nocardioides sp. TaxID=35761 RepID=UPI0037837A2E
MCEGHAEAAADRERVRDRLRALIAERKALDRRRQELTEELHRTLRIAHDVGWSWSEIAAFAEYKNAAAASNQAKARDAVPRAPDRPGTYSVREAAKRLGKSTQTIYTWIESGLLEAEDGPRGKRVFLPDIPSSLIESE